MIRWAAWAVVCMETLLRVEHQFDVLRKIILDHIYRFMVSFSRIMPSATLHIVLKRLEASKFPRSEHLWDVLEQVRLVVAPLRSLKDLKDVPVMSWCQKPQHAIGGSDLFWQHVENQKNIKQEVLAHWFVSLHTLALT